MGFGKLLQEKIINTKNLCVGIDPSKALLEKWNLDYTPLSIEKFSKTIIDSCAKKVPAVKPQSAFFESFGSCGIKILEKITHYAHKNDLLVILDVKRGDIGSTMLGYANAYLSPSSPFYTDAITLSPFLGFKSLLPTIEIAEKNNKGVFVLVKTSNPEGVEVQSAIKNNKTISENLIDNISDSNKGIKPIGNVGAVIGTTFAQKLDTSNLNGFILAPGIGAQGGTTLKNAANVLYSASRSITEAPDEIVEKIAQTNV